jgi:hypothetical protein
MTFPRTTAPPDAASAPAAVGTEAGSPAVFIAPEFFTDRSMTGAAVRGAALVTAGGAVRCTGFAMGGPGGGTAGFLVRFGAGSGSGFGGAVG